MHVDQFKVWISDGVASLTGLALAGVCFCLISCSVKMPLSHSQRSLQEDLYVENFKQDYNLELDKPASGYAISLRTPSKNIPLNTPDNAADSVIYFKNIPTRPLFNVVMGVDTAIVSNRHIYFKKVSNFRDIGGLKTREGKTVRWGKIFRSGNLSGLKKKEFARFSDLHIATVYDLRTSHEIAGKEDHLPEGVKYMHAPTVQDQEGEIAKLKKKVIHGDISEAQATMQTVKFYEDAVTVNVKAFKDIIKQITDSDKPVLYHCSAGKDRTGILSALILSVLQVDRETIVNEYLLSNYYRRVKTEKMLGKAKLARVIKPRMDLKAIAVFMSVDKSFIDAVFETIDKKYGGIDPFIQNQLGLDSQARKRFTDKMTY